MIEMRQTSEVQITAGINFKMIQQNLQLFSVDWNLGTYFLFVPFNAVVIIA